MNFFLTRIGPGNNFFSIFGDVSGPGPLIQAETLGIAYHKTYYLVNITKVSFNWRISVKTQRSWNSHTHCWRYLTIMLTACSRASPRKPTRKLITSNAASANIISCVAKITANLCRVSEKCSVLVLSLWRIVIKLSRLLPDLSRFEIWMSSIKCNGKEGKKPQKM